MVGVCGPLPKSRTLFTTKICDFPYPIYDLNKILDTLFMTVAAETVALNIIFSRAVVYGLMDNDEKQES